MTDVFTAQEKYLRGLSDNNLAAVENYLTNSLLDWIQLSKNSTAATVIAEQRDAVSAEMRRRRLPLSMASQMAERRNLLTTKQAIAA